MWTLVGKESTLFINNRLYDIVSHKAAKFVEGLIYPLMLLLTMLNFNYQFFSMIIN